MSLAKQRTRRCLDALRDHGRVSGGMAKAEAFSGVAEGYLRKAMHPGHGHGISLERFFSLLEGLQVSPRDFFTAALADDPAYHPQGLIDPPRGPGPAIIGRTRNRALSGSRGSIGETFLLDLDDMWFDKPEKAARLAEGAVEFTEIEHLPLLLGIFASACRSLLRLDCARHALREGIDLAVRQESSIAVADLIQRNAFLQIADGCYSRALMMSERAGVLFSRAGRLDRFGRALIDQGIALFYLEKTAESTRALCAGLELVPLSHHRHQSAALQILGLICLQDHEPEKALGYFDRCEPFARKGLDLGKLTWVRGGALAELGRWSEAMDVFESAVETLLLVSPVDAALCVCDQVKWLLNAGRRKEAVAWARTMRRIVVPLEDANVAGSAAARDLLCTEVRGQRRLTSEVLSSVERRLLESRRSYPRPAAMRG